MTDITTEKKIICGKLTKISAVYTQKQLRYSSYLHTVSLQQTYRQTNGQTDNRTANIQKVGHFES